MFRTQIIPTYYKIIFNDNQKRKRIQMKVKWWFRKVSLKFVEFLWNNGKTTKKENDDKKIYEIL